MKRSIIALMTIMIATCGLVQARTTYDARGNIINDSTIRGQKHAAIQRIEAKKKMQAAAAARLDYDTALKNLEEEQSAAKSNSYQNKTGQ